MELPSQVRPDAPDATGGLRGPATLLTRHLEPSALRRRVADGSLVRVRRGAYSPRSDLGAVASERRTRVALATIAAVARQHRSPLWFTHQSAALLWQLPVVGPLDGVHVLQGYTAGTGRDRDVHRHTHAVEPRDLTVVAGLPATGLERTVLDCASTMAPGAVLALADEALRRGADRERFAHLVAAAAGRRGVAVARRVLAVADPRSESPGESMTRWILTERGLAPDGLQVSVRTRLGWFRPDLSWSGAKVCLEFDGLVKYSGAFGSTAVDAVVAEKRRQDALEESGWLVLRVTWADLARPDELADRVARALARRAGTPS